MTDSLRHLLRPELRDLRGYVAGSPERDLVRLHANEAPYDFSDRLLNRYPEPQPARLLQRLAWLYDVRPDNLLLTRGSDDAIDLLVRCFCRAGQDAIAICPPTFGMYAVAARLQNASVTEVPLRANAGFAVDVDAVLERFDEHTRLVFLCSPNNPTGNLVPAAELTRLCAALDGRAIVVVDEAYIEFAATDSFATLVNRIPNLAVLRTLSKAFALAGARCGTLIGPADLIDLLRPALPPYPLSTLTIEAAIDALSQANLVRLRVRLGLLQQQRESLCKQLDRIAVVERTWPSHGNFVLAQVTQRERILHACREHGILIRDLGNSETVRRHVRITVGTSAQNGQLLDALRALR